MGRHESGTLARLRKNRSECLNPVLTKYGGRLVKLTGDGALIEFGSVVDALSAAIEFQQAMAEANRDQPADGALVFRIGLHLGDLIVDGDDQYGDGVNIAARLEAEAPAGGILISRNVHEAVTGRVKATFEDRGSLTLKNIERPVQAFSVKWEPSDWQTPVLSETAAGTTSPLSLPDKPSIAVLPFENMSSDPEARRERGMDTDPLPLPMTRTDIADFLGVRIETICRILRKLKDHHYLDEVDAEQVVVGRSLPRAISHDGHGLDLPLQE